VNGAASLAKFSADLRRLPTTVAIQVAKAAAPAITALAKESYDASTDPYGAPWAPSKKTGKRVTLRKSGALERRVYYVAIGTKLRVALGVDYAKYQIGKRPVFPKQNGLLPLAYSAELARVAVAECRKAFGR